MDNRRVPINVSVNPSEYSGRSIRLGNSDIREKMNQRMREFEEESKKWREQFMGNSSPVGLLDHRPKMFFNFPEFPELSSGFCSPLSSTLNSRLSNSGSTSGFFPSSVSQTSHKSFMEEDDSGSKRYKMTFDVGDFKPSEIQVKTEGRQLIVKGDREVVAGSATESKQFNREITLPDFIEPTSVTSYLNDGVLTVEAPVLLDRLGYSNNPAIANVTSSSSTLRNSPFRDSASPSRAGSSLYNSSSSTRNFANNRGDDLINSASNLHSSFNTPFFNDLPSATASTSLSSANLNHNLNNSATLSSTSTVGNSQPVVYKFNMSEFRPEDIAITVTDTTLKIHAVREENDSRGSGKTYREFKREIGLPQGSDVRKLKNSLQSDGTLIIEIPVNDNQQLRPALSPTSLNKQFSNFSFNDNNSTKSTASTATATNDLANSSSTTNASNYSSSNNGGLIDQTNDGKELRLTFDLTGYKPEDLSIKVIDNNILKVHAVHIDNTRGNQIHREYTRQYILPDWIQPELLRARMSDDGTLTVEVPLPQVQPNKFERLINIQNSNNQ